MVVGSRPPSVVVEVVEAFPAVGVAPVVQVVEGLVWVAYLFRD